MDNVSSEHEHTVDNITLSNGFDAAIVVFTSVVGLVSFLENSVILVLLFNLLKTLKPEQHEFIKQLLFVSGIDTLSSLTLFCIGITTVSSDRVAFFCAIVTSFTATFQAMSLSNFTCICTFRYIIARNVRVYGANRKSRFMIILLIVNSLNFTIGVTSFLSTVRLRKIPDGTTIACDYMFTVTERAQKLIAFIFFLSACVCTILSDIMCLLTALRLNKELNVVSKGPSATAESSITRQPESGKNSSKLSQRRAMCTIAVINACFNVSIIPLVIYFAISFSGINTSPHVGRFVFVLMFLNSMFNPIIIVVRFREIRRIFWQYLETFKVRLCRIT